MAEEETRRRIEIRLREKQDGEQRQQQQQLPLKPSDVPESDLTPNKEGMMINTIYNYNSIWCMVFIIIYNSIFNYVKCLCNA